MLSFAGLSASFGAFLWSHPPTAYQFLLVFGPCFVVWAMWMKRLRGLLIIGCAMGVGSTIAAAYFLPAVAEQNLVNYDDVERTWPYHASYVYDFAQKVYDHANDSFFIRLDRIWAFNALAIFWERRHPCLLVLVGKRLWNCAGQGCPRSQDMAVGLGRIDRLFFDDEIFRADRAVDTED